MKLTGNTIFITGGGSGIGRGLAEALYALGNQVIISGRRKTALEETTRANSGMDSIELDVEVTASIAAVAATLIAKYPKLNVVINNAGIMQVDDAAGTVDDALLLSTVTTNMTGPIRITSALMEQLKKQEAATVAYVTSGLAFVPLAMTAVYSGTKVAMHSYALSQHYKLKGTSVRVLEIVPPYVQTELRGAQMAQDPRVMPLKEFIAETIELLGTDADEVLTQRVGMQRNNPGPNEGLFVNQFNDMVAGH